MKKKSVTFFQLVWLDKQKGDNDNDDGNDNGNENRSGNGNGLMMTTMKKR